MAGTLTISTLSDGTNSTSATNCIQGSAKAWVNFTGVTTATVNNSYNISSVTRNGTGDYTVSFTNAMANANYTVAFGVTSGYDAGYGTVGFYSGGGDSTTAPSQMTTSALRFVTSGKYGTSASLDSYTVTATFFGS